MAERGNQAKKGEEARKDKKRTYKVNVSGIPKYATGGGGGLYINVGAGFKEIGGMCRGQGVIKQASALQCNSYYDSIREMLINNSGDTKNYFLRFIVD